MGIGMSPRRNCDIYPAPAQRGPVLPSPSHFLCFFFDSLHHTTLKYLVVGLSACSLRGAPIWADASRGPSFARWVSVLRADGPLNRGRFKGGGARPPCVARLGAGPDAGGLVTSARRPGVGAQRGTGTGGAGTPGIFAPAARGGTKPLRCEGACDLLMPRRASWTERSH